MNIYPDNTTMHFYTYLPQQFNLEGQWTVWLTDIQIRYTYQHFSNDKSDRVVGLHTVSPEKAETTKGAVVNSE